jgi:hypothetical protein
VDGDPADHVGAVDDSDPAAELGRAYGGLLAAGAGSDDKHVEVAHAWSLAVKAALPEDPPGV